MNALPPRACSARLFKAARAQSVGRAPLKARSRELLKEKELAPNVQLLVVPRQLNDLTPIEEQR
jgi:hypothetical protein